MVGDTVEASAGIIGIRIHRFKRFVLTYIILYFGHSVKYVIHIFYHKAARVTLVIRPAVGHGGHFTVVGVGRIAYKRIIARGYFLGVAKRVIREGVRGAFCGDGGEAIGDGVKRIAYRRTACIRRDRIRAFGIRTRMRLRQIADGVIRIAYGVALWINNGYETPVAFVIHIPCDIAERV